MKLLKSTLLMAGVSLAAFAASAENNGFYVNGNLGYSHTTKAADDFNKMNNSDVFSVAFGYQYNEHFRTDLGFEYRGKYDIKNKEGDLSGKLNSYAFMLNGYYDIVNYNGFTPFVGAGIGWAENKTSSVADVESDFSGTISNGTRKNFAWKLIAGTKYTINSSFDINAQYQYASLGKFVSGTSFSDTDLETNEVTNMTLEAPLKGKLRAHEFLVGISYKF